MTSLRFPVRRSTLTLLLVSVLALAAAPCVQAQDAESPEEESCPVEPIELADAGEEATASSETANVPASPGGVPVTSDTPAVEVEPQTNAETAIQAMLKQDGVHVVHFWAPWCSNAKNELAAGWGDLVQDNPDVTFTFVSIWNDNERAADVLAQYDLPKRVTTFTQPDLGPSDDESNRRKVFLGIPMTWSPSTWIFHNNGELAFAMNYGEMDMQTIQTLLDATQKDW